MLRIMRLLGGPITLEAEVEILAILAVPPHSDYGL